MAGSQRGSRCPGELGARSHRKVVPGSGKAVGGVFKVSLQGLMDAAADRYGSVIASTKNELGRKLESLAPKLQEYDGIILQTNKRVGTERGVHLIKAREVSDAAE